MDCKIFAFILKAAKFLALLDAEKFLQMYMQYLSELHKMMAGVPFHWSKEGALVSYAVFYPLMWLLAAKAGVPNTVEHVCTIGVSRDGSEHPTQNDCCRDRDDSRMLGGLTKCAAFSFRVFSISFVSFSAYT